MNAKSFGRYRLMILGIVIFVFSMIYAVATGNNFDYSFDPYSNLHEYSADTEFVIDGSGKEILKLQGYEAVNGKVILHLKGLKSGKAYVLACSDRSETDHLNVFYVHENGMVTAGDYFGECQGSLVLQIIWTAYLIAVALGVIRKYITESRKNFYRYSNILYLSFFIFLCFFIITRVRDIVQSQFDPWWGMGLGLIDTIHSFFDSFLGFCTITFPIVIIVSVFAGISNLELLRKEGRTWRNILAFLLGTFIIMAFLVLVTIELFFGNAAAADSQGNGKILRYVILFLLNAGYMFVTYLECILLSTVIAGIKAAKNIPDFDRDYILILGSRIKSDGTLTKLLQSRADRAIEFAGLQKEATGKDIYFVPSGGKGSDECLAEGEAVANYLIEQGISSERILVENRSKNTNENLKFSRELIQTHFESEDAKIAFSTTNYHVFRAGLLASENGIAAQGIGSKTRTYFWVNAFVREFIAIIVSERKKLALVLGIMEIVSLVMTIFTYFSSVVMA